MNTEEKTQDEFLKYRWEFLRRNEQYQKDWSELQKSHNDENAIAFSVKWNIRYPMDPNLSYDDLEQEILEQANEVNISISSLISPIDGFPVKLILGYGFLPLREDDAGEIPTNFIEEICHTGTLKIEIDLFYSKAKIIKAIDRVVSDAHRYLEEKLGDDFKQKQLSMIKRRHYDNFENYLRVYDLKKAGRTWRQIKEELNLNDIQTARDHHKAASKLVDQGLTV